MLSLAFIAGRLGIEPRFTASKAVVRPLDDLPIRTLSILPEKQAEGKPRGAHKPALELPYPRYEAPHLSLSYRDT